MKKIINPSSTLYLVFLILVAAGIDSCKKNTVGMPSISGVRTLYKSRIDSSVMYTVTYKDSAGIVVTDSVTTINTTPNVFGFDSATTAGNLGNMYVILGRNLNGATQVLFNGFPVYFNPALASDNSILVTIPQNTPAGPGQSNTLTVVTLNGKADFSFSVLLPPPTISALSDYNFTAGSQITLGGIGFASVTSVGLTGVADVVTIISQSDTSITLQFPATAATRANLVFVYGSGTSTTAQEFVNLDNAYQIFTDDFQNNWADNSWSGPSGKSNATAKTGTASYVITYPAGGWKIEGAANWNFSMAYDPSYKYLSFWIKGGVAPHNLVLVGDKMDGGYNQNTASTAWQVKVPAAVWTYYKIPLGAPSSTDPALLNFWKTGSPAQELGFFLQGQTGDVDETMYIDDLIFIK